METTTQPQVEVAASSLYGQGGACVAMMACNLVMLLMLTACSPGAQGQVLPPPAAGADAPVHAVAVPRERVTVTPSPEGRPIPELRGRLIIDDGR